MHPGPAGAAAALRAPRRRPLRRQHAKRSRAGQALPASAAKRAARARPAGARQRRLQQQAQRASRPGLRRTHSLPAGRARRSPARARRRRRRWPWLSRRVSHRQPRSTCSQRGAGAARQASAPRAAPRSSPRVLCDAVDMSGRVIADLHRLHRSMPESCRGCGLASNQIVGPSIDNPAVMNECATRQRPLAIGPLRAFEAVARLLSFRAAAEELHLTQPAISRQIRGLEDELGAALFSRGTRHVELTGAGTHAAAQRGAAARPARRHGAPDPQRAAAGSRWRVTTFASFASLWLLPRLQGFQAAHPEIDIRISANDRLADLDDPEIDLALRYCLPKDAPPGSVRTVRRGADAGGQPGAAVQRAAAWRRRPTWRSTRCSRKTTTRPSAEYLSWRHWLALHRRRPRWSRALGVPELHLPADPGRAGRPGRGAGAPGAGARVAGARRTGRALRRRRAHQLAVCLLAGALAGAAASGPASRPSRTGCWSRRR